MDFSFTSANSATLGTIFLIAAKTRFAFVRNCLAGFELERVSQACVSVPRSLIQDTDFASETANLSRPQILQQAGTAMVAQANPLPQGVLALLRHAATIKRHCSCSGAQSIR